MSTGKCNILHTSTDFFTVPFNFNKCVTDQACSSSCEEREKKGKEGKEKQGEAKQDEEIS